MKFSFQNPTGQRTSGFTLVELMLSMAITAIIVSAMVALIGTASDTWARNSAQVRAARQAKVFIDTMAKDLESMVSRPGNRFGWLHAEMDTSANLPNVTRGQAGSSEAAALTFMTAATDRYLGQVGTAADRGGDISCASYRLRYQDPIDGGTDPETSTFVLYRLLVDPDETFANLLGQEDLGAAIDAYSQQMADRENFICENVHQFTITFLVEVQRSHGNGTRPETVRATLSSDAPAGRFTVTGSGLDTDITVAGVSAEQLAAGRLRAVEISLSVLSDAGITRRNAGDGLSPADYAGNVFHYSRVVTVPSL